MSITIHPAIRDGDILVCVSAESISEFKQLVTRAMNTWQEASDEMERFSEIIQFGRVVTHALQNLVPSYIDYTPCSNCGEAKHRHPYRNCDEFLEISPVQY